MFKCVGPYIKIHQGLNIYMSYKSTREVQNFVEDRKKGQTEVVNVIKSEEFTQKLLKTRLYIIKLKVTQT